MKATVEILVRGGPLLLPAGTLFGTRGEKGVLLFRSELEVSTMAGGGGSVRYILTATEPGCDHNVNAGRSWWVDELGPIVNGVCNIGGFVISNPNPASGGVDPE